MITLLKQGPAAIQAVIDHGKELGVVLSDAMVARGGQASLAVQDLWSSLRGLANTLMDELAPDLTKAVEGLTAQIVAARESGKATEVLNDALSILDALLSSKGLSALENGIIGGALFGVQGAAIGAAAGFFGLNVELDKLSKLLQDPLIDAFLGAAAGSRLGPWGAVIGGAAAFIASSTAKLHKQAKPVEDFGVDVGGETFGVPHEDFSGYEVPMAQQMAGYRMPAAPQSSPLPSGLFGAGTRQKPGAGTDAAALAMASFIETMNQETAKGAGDTQAILDAWYGKQLASLAKWKDAGLDTTDALDAINAAYYSKQEKLDSDFNDWYIAGLGKTYGALYAEEEKKLKTVAGNAAQVAQVQEVFSKKWSDLQENQQLTATNLFKGYLDSMASLSPLLSQQIEYKQQALALEMSLADQALLRQLRDVKITQDEYDQAKALQALVNQAKLFSLEQAKWATQGFSGGLQQGALDLEQANQSWTANQVSSFVKGAPQQFSQEMATDFVNFLQGKKTDLQALGYSMAETMIQKLTEGLLNQVLPLLANGMAKILGGGGSQDWSGWGGIGADAHGNAYWGGVRAFAGGGVVNRPTLFALANGMGLMGEAGPEAVMPLTRTGGGDLGVRAVGAVGAPKVNLTINNNVPNTQVNSEQQSNGDLIVTVDQLTAKAYARGGQLQTAVASGRGIIRR